MLNAGPLLEQLMLRESLSQTEAYSLFNSIMHGEQSEVMIAAVLTALKMKKESPGEIAGAVPWWLTRFPFPHPLTNLQISLALGVTATTLLTSPVQLVLLLQRVG